LGFELSDLITLLPASLLTFIKVSQKGVKPLLRFASQIFLYFLLPFIVGIILSAILRTFQISLRDWAIQVGFLIYNIALFVSLYLFWKNNRLWQVILALVQLVGVILLTLGIPLVAASQTQLSTQVQLTQNIQFYPVFQAIDIFLQDSSIFIWLFLIIFFLPMLFGAEVGKITIEKKVLSKITGLVLKHPVPLLKEYEQIESIVFVRTNIWDRLCISKKYFPAKVSAEVNNYVFSEDVSLFLVETFKNTIACYFTKINSDTGKLIIIDRETVVAMAVEESAEKKSVKPS
jgi:hypothetical protein